MTESYIPKHVAIIMDGNGRWAVNRGRHRIWGHIRGSKNISQIVETVSHLKIKALTLYSFSTENWSRPLKEIQIIFSLINKYIKKERSKIIENHICFKTIGNMENLPQSTATCIKDLEHTTKLARGLKLTFAFDYGGRTDIVNSINKFIGRHPTKEMTEKDLTDNLSCPELGDVDLLLRTGGDQRISNFLLWQSAYAELFFTKTKWPDFTSNELVDIFNQFSKRKRRFGSISQKKELQETLCLASKQKNSFINMTKA